MDRALEEKRTLYEETLPYIGRKIDFIIATRSQRGKRRPVDCIAFASASRSVSIEAQERTDYHHAVCIHPDRGKQFGCLLTREERGGRIIRVLGAKCELRIKKGRRGSANLRERIRGREEEKFPF